MSKLVLQYHTHKKLKADDENDLVVLFLFSLSTEGSRDAGVQLDQQHAFWCEVSLRRDLAARGRWAQLSTDDKVKAMLRWAQEKIQERGTKLRSAPMFWTATSPLADGPPWELATIKFPDPDPVTFDTTQEMLASGLASKEAAGHLK